MAIFNSYVKLPEGMVSLGRWVLWLKCKSAKRMTGTDEKQKKAPDLCFLASQG